MENYYNVQRRRKPRKTFSEKNKIWILGKSTPSLTKEEELNIFNKRDKSCNINQEDIEKLIMSNVPIVFTICLKEFRLGSSCLLQDAVNEGIIGIIEASKRFDHTLGYRFNTYARPWIKKYIIDFIIENKNVYSSKAITRNIFTISKFLKDNNITNATSEKINGVDYKEISNKTGMSTGNIEHVMNYFKGCVYINSLQSTDDSDINSNSNIVEGGADNSVPDDMLSNIFNLFTVDIESQEDAIIKNDLKEKMDLLRRNILSEKEYFVISMYYGIEQDSPKTFNEISKVFIPKLTRARVQQIHATGVEKLKKNKKYMSMSKDLASMG